MPASRKGRVPRTFSEDKEFEKLLRQAAEFFRRHKLRPLREAGKKKKLRSAARGRQEGAIRRLHG